MRRLPAAPPLFRLNAAAAASQRNFFSRSAISSNSIPMFNSIMARPTATAHKFFLPTSINSSRRSLHLSAPSRGPYLDEYFLSPEWECAMLPPSFWNWLFIFWCVILGNYIMYMFHYNYYYYGVILIKTHTGLRLTEDSWWKEGRKEGGRISFVILKESGGHLEGLVAEC